MEEPRAAQHPASEDSMAGGAPGTGSLGSKFNAGCAFKHSALAHSARSQLPERDTTCLLRMAPSKVRSI